MLNIYLATASIIIDLLISLKILKWLKKEKYNYIVIIIMITLAPVYFILSENFLKKWK